VSTEIVAVAHIETGGVGGDGGVGGGVVVPAI
jgi:hypothetical protein